MIELIGLGAVAIMALNKKEEPKSKDPFFEWDALIKKYSDQFKVPFDWVKAIMLTESSLGQARSVKRGIENPNDIEGSKSSDGKSWGLMQTTIPTARMFEPGVTAVQLNDPETSIRLGVKYLAWLISKKGLNEELVIRSYNGGAGFLASEIGRNMTALYYAKFTKNLALVRSKQK